MLKKAKTSVSLLGMPYGNSLEEKRREEKTVNSLPLPRIPFCEYPLSAAILRALVTASARLTEPE